MNKLCKKRNSTSTLEGRIPKQTNHCLHSQIIYGDFVETFEPIIRRYMKIPILIPNNIVTIGYFYGQANVV